MAFKGEFIGQTLKTPKNKKGVRVWLSCFWTV